MNKNQFPRRAAEASTSEQSVRRYLRTHRICSPPDYRQLAARGLAPRKIHSIADCSVNVLPLRWFCGLFGNSRSQFERKSVDGCECAMIERTDFRIILSICLCPFVQRLASVAATPTGPHQRRAWARIHLLACSALQDVFSEVRHAREHLD